MNLYDDELAQSPMSAQSWPWNHATVATPVADIRAVQARFAPYSISMEEWARRQTVVLVSREIVRVCVAADLLRAVRSSLLT